MKYLLFTFTLIFFVAAEQNEKSDLKSTLQDLTNAVGDKGLASSLQNVVPNLPFVMEGLPSMDEGADMIREKCQKNGQNGSYERALEAKEQFQLCVKDLVNFEDIESEIEKAKPTGDLDTVFRKYCKKTPVLKECIANFTEAFAPCLDPKEISSKDLAVNMSDSLMKFICFKEGDRIALFIAEGGPECLKDHVSNINDCWNSTFSDLELNPNANTTEIPEMVLDEEKCKQLTKVQECVVKHLETCKEPTPANVIGSMILYIKKRSPCYQFEKAAMTGAGISNQPSPTSFALSFLLPILGYAISKI